MIRKTASFLAELPSCPAAAASLPFSMKLPGILFEEERDALVRKNDLFCEVLKLTANNVLQTLFGGFSASQYRQALQHELKLKGVQVQYDIEHGINQEILWVKTTDRMPIAVMVRADKSFPLPYHANYLRLALNENIYLGQTIQKAVMVNFPQIGKSSEIDAISTPQYIWIKHDTSYTQDSPSPTDKKKFSLDRGIPSTMGDDIIFISGTGGLYGTDHLLHIANSVFKSLGPGHQEKAYQLQLQKRLAEEKIYFDSELVIPVYYKKHYIGTMRPDVVVDMPALNGTLPTRICIELKAVSDRLFPRPSDVFQVGKYISHGKFVYGLCINFPQSTSGTLISRHDNVQYFTVLSKTID